MEIFSLFNVLILAILSIVQSNFVGGTLNPNSACGGIFEGDAGEVEYHRENSIADVDDASGSSVCIWMVKLLRAGGAGVSLRLEDLDENSVVNFYAEGEPTDPVNTPITLNSTQINSAVELSGKIFIITLKSQLYFENSATKLVLSWSRLEQTPQTDIDSKVNGYKILPVEFTSTNYFTAGGEKGRYNFKNFYPLQKSVWILDAGVEIGIDGGGSLNAEVNVELDSSSCPSELKSLDQSENVTLKALCECSYFGLFEVLPSTGKLRLAGEFCGRSGSFMLTKLSTQLVVFIYAGDTNSGSGSGESAKIRWERNKETTNPTTTMMTTTTTESTTTPEPEPPIKAPICPDASTILPCTCGKEDYGTEISCVGSAVDQTSVENSFRELRRVNEIPEDRGIDIYQFILSSTELTQFDMAPLYASRMDYLHIWYNYNLTNWVTSGNPQDHGSIHVDYFHLEGSPINKQEFGDTFKYFSVQMTTFVAVRLPLNLNNNDNDEDESEFEFLPGLSALVNLRHLTFDRCNISGRLNSPSLEAFPRLETIYLWDNEINGIGENLFPVNVSSINLRGNKLNETSFHPKSGIAQTGHKNFLYLESNQIATLPSEIFQIFLDAHPGNVLSLKGNPLICDERLSWIKSRREEFQSRVKNADCSNDPGHTVFDSDLIP